MRIQALILALGAIALLATGCARNEEPAKQAVISSETALNQVRPKAAQYLPEELQTVDAKLAELKAKLAKEEYKAVISESKDFNAEVIALNDAVVAKQTQLAAATHEWEQLSEEVPKIVQAIEGQVNNLQGTRRETAKAELASMKSLWDEASAAFDAGNPTMAADKGRLVQAKAKEVSVQLGMSPV